MQRDRGFLLSNPVASPEAESKMVWWEWRLEIEMEGGLELDPESKQELRKGLGPERTVISLMVS